MLNIDLVVCWNGNEVFDDNPEDLYLYFEILKDEGPQTCDDNMN